MNPIAAQVARFEADDELKVHAIRPEFVISHEYAVGDVLAWDTAATLHRAPMLDRATGPGDSRLLHRISVKGGPPSTVRGKRGPATRETHLNSA